MAPLYYFALLSFVVDFGNQQYRLTQPFIKKTVKKDREPL